MDEIYLIGRSRRPVTINLPHDIFCEQVGQCACRPSEEIRTVTSKEGLRKRRRVTLRHPCVLTIRFRERKRVPRCVLACPEVKGAIKLGWLSYSER